MQVERLQEFVHRAKSELNKSVKHTQFELEESKSKEYDLYLLSKFWDEVVKYGLDYWKNDIGELLEDHKAMMPMPESVHKQFLNQIFKTKNINLLTDLEVGEDLPDSDNWSEKDVEDLKKKVDSQICR